MNKNLELAQYKFIEGVSRMGDAFGMNRFVIQLYAFLYLTGKPLSLDEIAESLGVSKGNVSINIRELEKWGAVKNIWIKGSRKDYYQTEPNVKKVFLNKVKSAIQKRIDELSGLLAEFEQTLKSADGDLTEEEAKVVANYAEKLEKIKEMKDMIIPAVEILSKLA